MWRLLFCFSLVPGCVEGGAPLAGQETGPCVEGSCFDGLMCLSDLCVEPDGEPGETGGEAGTAATAGSTTTGQMTETGSGTTDGPTNGTSDDPSDSSMPPDETSGSTGDGPKGPDGTPEQPRQIWVSNADEGTISKINTETVTEEARYITREDSNGDPSRTSVNYNGDVAVANRSGGISVFAGDIEDCPDPLATSGAPDDVRPYPDGCLLWHTPGAYASQRPVAWTQGEWNDTMRRFEETKVWTSGANATIEVLLLDGDTGDVEETIPIPGVAANFYGIYGGAVDSEGNFWGSQLGVGSLIRVQLSDFSVDTWPMEASGYGITIDQNGMIWTCSAAAARFDPTTETWDVFASAGGSGGCNVDGDGVLWMANNPLIGLDTTTGAVLHSIDLPNYVHGVAVDFDGFVWGAATFSDEAYRVDPGTNMVETVTGLNNPYTYSDMTGFGLQNVGP